VTPTAKTKLVLISNSDSTNSGPRFFLRDTTGGTNIDTEVTAFLALDILDDVHKVVTSGTKTATTRYAVVRLSLTGTGTQNFDLSGTMTVSEGTLLFHSTVIEDNGLKTAVGQVAGSGEIKNRAGTPEHAVVKGTITATGGKPETL